MYIAKLSYKVNEEVKVLTHAVESCHMYITKTGQNCNLIMSNPFLVNEYELVAAEGYKVVSLILVNADEQEIYNSNYWNRVISIQNNFPDTGIARCELQLDHEEVAE